MNITFKKSLGMDSSTQYAKHQKRHILFTFSFLFNFYLIAHPQMCGRKMAGKFCGYSCVIVTELKPARSRNTHVGLLKQHPPITNFHIGSNKP